MNKPLPPISVIPARNISFTRVSKNKATGKQQTGQPTSASVPRSFSHPSASPTTQDICSARAVCAECCHHSPMQTAVVLKTPVRPNSLTRGATRTVLCQEVVQASKEHLRRHECVRAVKAKSGRAALLKLSRSLSDMDQKPESAAQTFSYVERTCSEGKLTHGQEQCLMLGTFCRKEKKPFPPRPFTRSNSKLSYFRSLSAHYAGVPGPGTTHSAIHIPLLEDRCDGESSRGKKLLSYIVSFSRNCSASSHELDSYFQAEKSSSVLVESAGFCSDDMGDDDVFEDSSSVRLKMTELRAPLCSVEKDSDLDCPSLLSENFPPLSPVSASGDACRICHCEGDEESPLIAPCRCTGSLNFVHQACLQHWIKSSDTRCCELCKYEFVMETKLKPWRKWEKLQMTSSERRKIICSVTFHVIAITCVIWSLYVLIDRTADEIKQGESTGILEWPFWTKLVVVAIGFTGGILFMYVQCKVYMQLWKRLKAYNRVIYVQNCPEASKKSRCEKPVQVEPNLENSGALLGYHAETNGSHYPEPEGPQANFLHI
ncbi:uncharacterized protein LOC123029671 [Varanus komodoensis]|uniref:uncharacterized protein LOC123029671 n=1 Tax=Varanus komodoensis TaxID=61221 RepID=UPI001CF7B851|nr:uncharacterized protein LOC123029671 [Varanus komodoensis]XP_044298793.1 uncharacterized protein LOC123029671 [Varanus komodoensis]